MWPRTTVNLASPVRMKDRIAVTVRTAMSERIYMECRARASSIWPLGTLMKTTCIDSEDIKEFLEFYEGYDPTMEHIVDHTGA